MYNNFNFFITNRSIISSARTGIIKTPHGNIETPAFIFCATKGFLRGITAQQLEECNTQIILSNTYHLNLRPGSKTIKNLGGLHQFMNWTGPILTDSGGYQVYSLAKMREITDKGIAFRSHLNGDYIFLGPLEVMSIQQDLGSDIAMVLDECPPYPCSEIDCHGAVNRSVQWAMECLSIAQEKLPQKKCPVGSLRIFCFF